MWPIENNKLHPTVQQNEMANFVTPITKQPLLQKDYDTLVCQESGVEYHRVNGVWRFIAAERRPLFEQFTHEYETIRLAEGRREIDPAFYRQLPSTPADHPAANMWQQRAHSFQTFVNSVLHTMEADSETALNILDLGAGNGWLSNQMSRRGHCVTAVDLIDNDFDGLGVHVCYERPFTSIQSEFDYLPLAKDQFNLVIFNASLHYSTDYTQTLSEALRVTTQNGRIVVIDTPVYQFAESGAQMVAEREADFETRFKFKSNSLKSENFLSPEKLKKLEQEIGIECQKIQTVPDFRRVVRRLKTMARGEREAAEFPILLFDKGAKSACSP